MVAEKKLSDAQSQLRGSKLRIFSNTKKANTNLSILIDNSGMIEANSFRLTRRLCGTALEHFAARLPGALRSFSNFRLLWNNF